MAIVYAQGAYWCEIVSQAISETRNGNPQIELGIKPYCREDETPVERQIERKFKRVLTEKTIDFAVEELRSLGYDRDTFAELDPRHPQKFDFTGIRAKFLCEYREYEGKEFESWSLLRDYQKAEVEPIDKAKLKRLDGLFGKALKAAPKVEKPTAPQSSSKPAASPTATELMDPPSKKPGAFVNDHGVEVDDDDLPF